MQVGGNQEAPPRSRKARMAFSYVSWVWAGVAKGPKSASRWTARSGGSSPACGQKFHNAVAKSVVGGVIADPSETGAGGPAAPPSPGEPVLEL